jgi:site-specific DNA recombinase
VLAHEKQRTHNHYLKGSLFCGRCGARLIVSKNRGRRGKLYEYFVCLGRASKRTPCLQKAILIEWIESEVEDHYLGVQPPRDLLDIIRDHLSAEIEESERHVRVERDVHTSRVRNLERERAKLLEGFYSGAIPTDLMRSEQSRISTALKSSTARLETLSPKFEVIEANLVAAIRLAENWHDAYMKATDIERRMLNQAIFDKLHVTDDGVTHDFAEPFDLILGETVVRTAIDRIDSSRVTTEQGQAIEEAWRTLSSLWAAEFVARDARASLNGSGNERTPEVMETVGGSNADYLVGAEGLEPRPMPCKGSALPAELCAP